MSGKLSQNGAQARIIPVDAYPPMLGKALVSKAAFELRSEKLKKQAGDILEKSSEAMRLAVLGYVERMEEGARSRDLDEVYAQAHEIRGLAATAGLVPAGTIANGLCRYIDESLRARTEPDGALVDLHVDAIARAARVRQEAKALGSLVAEELALLVRRKLREIKD